MRVLLFAGLADLAGATQIDLELPPLADGEAVHVADLRAAFERQVPAAVQTSYQVAVDHAYAQDGDPVQDGQEVAFIPPVSGG